MRTGLLLTLCLLLSGLTPAEAQVRSRQTSRTQLLQQQAETLLRLGRKEQAVALFRQLLESDPRNPGPYYRLASVLTDRESVPVLLDLLQILLDQQPGQVRLQAEKGRLLYLMDRREEADRLWQTIAERYGHAPTTFSLIAQTQLQAGAVEQALNTLQAGRERAGNPNLYALDVARVQVARMNFGSAAAEFLRHLADHPQTEQYIVQQLVRILENDEVFPQMEPVFLQFIAAYPERSEYVEILAKLYFNQRQYDKLTDLMVQRGEALEDRVWLNLAEDLRREEVWEAAARLYLEIAEHGENRKQQITALLGLAESYEQRLETRSSYGSLGGYFPGNRFLMLDVRAVDPSGGTFDRALALYDSLRFLLPRSPQANQAVYRIAEMQLTMLDDYDAAIRGFEQVLEKSSNPVLKVQAGVRLVDAWLARGDTVQASAELQRTIRLSGQDPDEPILSFERARVNMAKGDLGALQKELNNLMGSSGPGGDLFNDAMELSALLDDNGGPDNRALAQYFQGERLILQHKLSEAVKILTNITGGREGIADEAQVRAIQILQVLGDEPRADSLMSVFRSRFPESPWVPQVLVWQAEHAQFVRKDTAAAIPLYEEVLVNHPTYLEIQAVRQRLRQLAGEGS